MAHKLTDAQRNEVAQRFFAGEKGVALAKEFDVSPANVSMLAKTRGKRRSKKPPPNKLTWIKRLVPWLGAQ